MSNLNLKVSVHEGSNDGPPIEGASVFGQLPVAETGDDGIATLNVVDLMVTAPAFESYMGRYSNPQHDATFPIALQRRLDPPDPPHPQPPTLPELTVDGNYFRREDGVRWTAIGCSDFGLLAQYTNGLDITPVLKQRRDCGFNLLRVWTAFEGIDGIGTFTTIDYAKVPAFVALCAQYGLYVEFTAYTGVNDPMHWQYLCAAAYQCHPRPLLELVNELSENSNEPDSNGHVFVLSDHEQAPAPLLSSHGSNGSEKAPVRPSWSYEAFHTNGAFEWWRKVGHNAMECSEGAEGLTASNVPTYSNENTRYADIETNANHAFDAAAGAALLCAGSAFHSVSGKASQLWAGHELDCAQAWASGAASVDIAYQVGAYRHAVELEGPTVLRAYQRTMNGTAETVLIHK